MLLRNLTIRSKKIPSFFLSFLPTTWSVKNIMISKVLLTSSTVRDLWSNFCLMLHYIKFSLEFSCFWQREYTNSWLIELNDFCNNQYKGYTWYCGNAKTGDTTSLHCLLGIPRKTRTPIDSLNLMAMIMTYVRKLIYRYQMTRRPTS